MPFKEYISDIDPRSNVKNFIVFLLLVLISTGVGALFSLNSSSLRGGNNTNPSEREPNIPIAPYTLVYGFWSGTASNIAYYDLSKNSGKILASLPSSIKKVSVINPDELLYINQTDEYDRGRQVVRYSISTKNTQVISQASSNFTIDDYALSSNKRYLVLWELKPNSDFSLIGGASKMVLLDLSETIPIEKVIYSENILAGKPVHYPLSVTDQGIIMSDLFKPNDGIGFGYGWGKYDSNTQLGSDINSMKNGTISTQPIFSPDGTKFIFAGYDGSKGDGTVVQNGYRNAIANPNTIEEFDSVADKRINLALPNTDRYMPIEFADDGTLFVFKKISADTAKNGFYLYDFGTMSYNKIPMEEAKGEINPTIIHTLSKNRFIAGNQATSISSGANLGKKYSVVLNSVYLFDSQTHGKTGIPISNNGNVQYIDTVPQKYFADSDQQEPFPNGKVGNDQLQLSYFTPKEDLIKKRQQQQLPPTCGPTDYVNRPECNRCISLATTYCNNLLGTNFPATFYIDLPVTAPKIVPIPGAPTIGPKDITPLYQKFSQCYADIYIQASVLLCNNSPLYLYGTQGQKVNVVVGSPIYNSNASYSPIEGYAVTLGNSGKMYVGDKVYDKIDFDYIPGIKKLSPPDRGIIISKKEISEKMTEYALKLGLEGNEAKDLVAHVLSVADKPFLFVSHFDEETSKKTLPLSFSIHPDNYYNVVIYIKNLDKKVGYEVQEPIFEKITKRSGLTAVEVSFIVE